MSVSKPINKGSATPVKRPAIVVADFHPERVKAPFLLRCGALIIDYIIVVAIPVIFLLLSKYMGNDGAKLLNSELNNSGWLVGILVGFADLIILPIFSGQSIGKMMTGLRIVRNDGTPAPISSMILRQTFGYLLTVFSFGLGFIFSVFSSKGRALHDYLSGTVVIFAKKDLSR